MNLKKRQKVVVILKFINNYNNFYIVFKEVENELTMERKNYKDIFTKYELLQKEQIDVKSKLTAEKEKIQRYLCSLFVVSLQFKNHHLI